MGSSHRALLVPLLVHRTEDNEKIFAMGNRLIAVCVDGLVLVGLGHYQPVRRREELQTKFGWSPSEGGQPQVRGWALTFEPAARSTQ